MQGNLKSIHCTYVVNDFFTVYLVLCYDFAYLFIVFVHENALKCVLQSTFVILKLVISKYFSVTKSKTEFI